MIVYSAREHELFHGWRQTTLAWMLPAINDGFNGDFTTYAEHLGGSGLHPGHQFVKLIESVKENGLLPYRAWAENGDIYEGTHRTAIDIYLGGRGMVIQKRRGKCPTQ